MISLIKLGEKRLRMDRAEKNWQYFIAALESRLKIEGRGSQTAMSVDTKLSEGYISQIKRGKNTTFKNMVKMADSLGFPYLSAFLEYGQKIVDGEVPGKTGEIIQYPRNGFQGELNDLFAKLRRIKKNDPAKFEKIMGYIDGIAAGLGETRKGDSHKNNQI